MALEKTTTVRVDADIAAMIAAIAWYREVPASEIVSPLVRDHIAQEFGSLPDLIKQRFLPQELESISN
jgi:hypothetical protein